MEFYNNPTESLMEGQISDLFSAPVIPKMVVVGLSEDEIGGNGELRVFKEILERALNNLFVIEFLEQFIPMMPKIPNTQIHYRNHEVREAWMYKVRQELPALLIDFRLLSTDDSILIEQILQTKSSLPLDGPVYLVWLAGRFISAQRISSILKGTRLDKSTISSIELTDDPTQITVTLKTRIQECFEHSRQFYQNLSKKYKKLISKPEQSQKFIQPWMSSVYYYYKLAVLEEFRGDFQSALKYYHTILAKFKELIEEVKESVDQKYQIINYLRRFADICFIRLSFLLFRLDQSGEAEFGLFRYLNYFSHGLSHNEQLLWRFNMSRGFARQLGKSIIWSQKHLSLMRGPAHFFIYGLLQAEKYLKCSSGEDVYQIQEMIMKDLSEALESALQNSNLGYIVDYLQNLILNHYTTVYHDEDSKAFLNYLKTSPKIQNWKVIHYDILKKSALQAKGEQNYQTAVLDEWNQNLIGDFSSFEDWCLMHAQMYQEPIRLNFPGQNVNYIYCNVRFLKRKCEIFEACEVELNVYCRCRSEEVIFQPESIGIFFDNEHIDPITIICEDDFLPGEIKTFRSEFIPNKISSKLKISFVTMQLKRPFLALQFDDSRFYHQQNYPNDELIYENMKFVRLCQGTLKSMLTLRIEPLKPKISVTLNFKDTFVLMGSELAVLLNLKNETEHATMTNFIFLNREYNVLLGPFESQSIGLTYAVPCDTKSTYVFIKFVNKFNLELMDFRFTEICNFEPFESEFKSEKQIVPINPFKITLLLSRGMIEIQAFCDIEWISLNEMNQPYIIRKGQGKQFTILNTESVKGSFRLLEDSSKAIHQHEWKIK